jgi:hypothetical protein
MSTLHVITHAYNHAHTHKGNGAADVCCVQLRVTQTDISGKKNHVGITNVEGLPLLVSLPSSVLPEIQTQVLHVPKITTVLVAQLD